MDTHNSAICVLGMHRSGTSMVAGMLARAGVDFGPSQEQLPANQSNQLGYFEHQQIAYQVNEGLLEHYGGAWKSPPIFPPDWLDDEDIETFRQRAKSIVANFDKPGKWGWKDPRTSLLVPFWQSVLPNLSFVICVRNPLDVSISLNLRDGLSIQRASELWYRYTSDALKFTQGQKRVVVFYEEFFHSPSAETGKLIEFLGLSDNASPSHLASSIHARLRHHQSQLHDMEKQAEVDDRAKDLYLKLKHEFASNKHASPNQESVTTTTAALKTNQIVFPHFPDPLVSIVIPSYNRASLLAACLHSVAQYSDVPYQVIIVDDASTDETPELVKGLKNVKTVTNSHNCDFLKSANQGAAQADGKYILFLNNDVSVRANWLSCLVDTMEKVDKCGAVGAKLISTDGKLQEAGASVWSDGQVTLYGAGDNPFKPEYSYMRATDYCSGACLLVRKDLFQDIGGFDESFTPAYYEDVDLCLTLWSMGYKVIYQPRAQIFHHHMGSRSVDAVNSLLEKNRKILISKWQASLKNNQAGQNRSLIGNRYLGKRVLFVCHSESSEATEQMLLGDLSSMTTLAESGYGISCILAGTYPADKSLIHEMQNTGIEVVYGNNINLEKLLAERTNQYEYVVSDQEGQHPHIQMLLNKLFPQADHVPAWVAIQ